MKNLFAILFLFVSFDMYSQYNDVKMYFNDSTSIEGLGYMKKDKIYFKLEEKEKFSEWGMESIYRVDFFAFESEVRTIEYVYSDADNKFHLMELVVDGEVTLYKLQRDIIVYNRGITGDRTTSGSYADKTTPQYFVKHRKDKTATDILFGFKKRIARFFLDCPDIIEMVNDKTFIKDDIELIVKYYNDNCSVKN